MEAILDNYGQPVYIAFATTRAREGCYLTCPATLCKCSTFVSGRHYSEEWV